MSSTLQDATRLNLYADILANPADDGLRLIYADYLTDLDDEFSDLRHAAFIRWQIAGGTGREWPWDRAFVPECLSDMQRWTSRKDGSSVVVRFGEEGTTDYACWWTRGFVSAVRMPMADWMKYGKALVRQYPIERVEASDKHCRERTSSHNKAGWWTGTSYDDDVDDLPEPLWAFLECKPLHKNTHWRYYATVESANADLSHALIAYAKQEDMP